MPRNSRSKRNRRGFGRLFGRRGTEMVEAAIVFPIVVLVVVSLLYMMLGFYGDVCASADAHNREAAEAQEDGHVTYGEEEYIRCFEIAKKAVP